MRKIRLFGVNTIKNERTLYGLDDIEFMRALGISSDTPKSKINEIVYFICLKTLSEIMGKLDVKKYEYNPKKGRERIADERFEYLMNTEPNENYTASTLKQSIELNRNHYGNAYVYPERYRAGKWAGQVKALWILPSNEVTVWMDDAGIFGTKNAVFYEWQDSKTGNRYRFNNQDILHFKSPITFDGIVGLAVKDIIEMQINTALYGQSYISNLYKTNMNSKKVILNYTGGLDKPAEKALVSKMEEFTSTVGSGAFIPLPIGITATVLDSKLVDSEFSVLRQANALQIAAAFGVSPNFINDYSKSSYANSVTQQQALYTNTMMPIFKAYSEEYSRKLLLTSEKQKRRYEIDTKALFKLNPLEQIDVLQKGVQSLIYTPNEAREEMDLPYFDNEKANTLVGNGNMLTIDDVGKQYQKKGGEK